MKERPILFNKPMVQAILKGEKTQTRRLVANARPDNCLVVRKATKTKAAMLTHVLDAPKFDLCPLGKPGDRLWVRETWQGPLMDADALETEYRAEPEKFQNPEFCVYAADGGPAPEFVTLDDELVQRWCPSIHMPRWASRLLLEITAVRVEHLRDIADADAEAEGIAFMRDGPLGEQDLSPVELYASLWDAIYGVASFAANPWVWVVEFKRVEA